ncbi:cytochrome P450 [Fennellomyces sp. T-0311]|nr:cytochrome P450 [Fennellomyces sp. T-0311]
MEHLAYVWNSYVLPQLYTAKSDRRITTTAAAVVVLAYFLLDKILKPPRRLRHIPHASPFRTILSQIRDEGADKVTRSIAYPLTFKTEKGLYSKFDATGWTVIINDPDIAKEYLFKSTTFIKSPLGDRFAGTIVGQFILGPNILFLSGKQWRDQRKVANPAFHRQMPLALFGRLTEKMFAIIDQTEEIVDTYDLMERWTLDAIGNAGFGFDFDAISSSDNTWVRRYTHIVLASQKLFFGMFPFVERKLLRFFPGRAKSHRELKEFVDMIQGIINKKREVIAEREARGGDVDGENASEKDLLQLMIEGGHSEGGGLTDEELLSNICVFFFAGHDTTASALSFAICFLAMYPEIQQRAREEVIKILGDDPENVVPTVEQMQQLTYINMIIKETLRMYSPVDFLVPRVSVKDTTLGGVFIPKGTQITVSTYQLHHNPRVWENPDTFDPERFAPGNEYDNKQTYSWLPFSTGSRQCIGMNFSLAEQRLLLPMLLRKYEWHLPKDTIHTPESIITKRNLGVMSPMDLHVIFKRRY